MSLRQAPATAVLLLVIGIVYLFEFLTGASSDGAKLVRMGALTGDTFARGEYWRLVTAMFLHHGVLHFFLNAWALSQLGYVFETMFGTRRFLLIYFVTGIVASVSSIVFNTPPFIGVGASGAIFGVLGALIPAIKRSPRWRRHSWAGPFVQQLMMWAGINIIIGFTVEGIDNAAHLGGFVTGLVFGLLPHRMPPPPPGELVIDVTERRAE